MKKMNLRLFAAIIVTFCLTSPPGALRAQNPDSADGLTGLWKAKRRFGPDVRGPLLITRTGSDYTADLMGFAIPIASRAGELWFELPNREGVFRGRLERGDTLRGIWLASAVGSFTPSLPTTAATPVTLLPQGAGRWLGRIVPLEDEQTFYLLISRNADGSLAAVLRNPERDYGALLGVRGLVRSGSALALLGRRSGQTRDSAMITGSFDGAQNVIRLDFPFRGGTYDFRREQGDLSGFYPRGRNRPRYVYRVPPALDDGWPTDSVEGVGIDRATVERFVQHLIDMRMDSIDAPQVHSLLIARRGTLVLEEYFHGEHRSKLHNTRSASKSITSTIIGAAMFAGVPLRLSTSVYEVLSGGGALPADLDPRKRAMTLEHLLTMSSGYVCQDSDEWDQQDEPDFYEFARRLPMATAPGERAVYCSLSPNLALGIAGRVAAESPFYLFDRLVAAPLGITHYAWALDRAGNPYGGGGMELFARDFLKFGQLMLDGGTWRGRRILSRDYVERATSALARFGQRGYGLGWWLEEKPYRNRTVRGFAALGNGGQVLVVFPELEIVIATNGGSYASAGWRYIGGQLIPNHILPAVAP